MLLLLLLARQESTNVTTRHTAVGSSHTSSSCTFVRILFTVRRRRTYYTLFTAVQVRFCRFQPHSSTFTQHIPEMRLDLDLPPQLVLHPGPQQLVLLQDLEGHDIVRLLLSSEVHRPELALAQRQPDLEVGKAPMLALSGRRLSTANAAADAAAAIPFPRLLKSDALRPLGRRGIAAGRDLRCRSGKHASRGKQAGQTISVPVRPSTREDGNEIVE